jgi:hypothetical protein
MTNNQPSMSPQGEGNQVTDYKGPLKGKGVTLAQWRLDVTDRLAVIYQEMAQLADESASIQGRRFGLRVYKLRDALQLRWRMTNSAHATWARIEPLLAVVPEGLAQWYRQAESLAQVLNHREQALRYELKTVQRLETIGPRIPRTYGASIGRGMGGGRNKSKVSATVAED